MIKLLNEFIVRILTIIGGSLVSLLVAFGFFPQKLNNVNNVTIKSHLCEAFTTFNSLSLDSSSW